VSSSREAIARRQQQCGYHHHRPRGATCEKDGVADEGMPCCYCPRPRDHRLAPAVLCMSALRCRIFPPSSPTPGGARVRWVLGPVQMTRSLVFGMPGVSTMHVVVMRRTCCIDETRLPAGQASAERRPEDRRLDAQAAFRRSTVRSTSPWANMRTSGGGSRSRWH
jgi:hypothetical protein